MRLPQSTRSRDLAQDQSGMVLLFWAFSMLGLLGFLASVADTGLASMERRELQNTADAAAMAGAQDLLLTGGGAEAGAESFAATVHSGLVGNQAVLQDFRVTSNVSANAQSLLDESGPLSFGAPLIGASATARLAAPVWPAGSGPVPYAVGQNAYYAAVNDDSGDLTLMCGGATEGSVIPGCGIVDISLILDVSYSIVQAGAMDDLQAFSHDVVDAFTLNLETGAAIGITAFAEQSVSIVAMAANGGMIGGAINANVDYGPIAGPHYTPGAGWHWDYRPWGTQYGQTGMYTDMLAALQGGADQYTNGVTDRDFAPNVIVIVTDAEDTEGHNLSQIVALRNAILSAGAMGQPNGAEVIIAVGVGDQNDAVLDALATGGHVYSTDAWDGLDDLLTDITVDVCSFAEPPVNPTPATPVDLGGMGADDFQHAALYGGRQPDSPLVGPASEAEYLAMLAGLRTRFVKARQNDCYTWAEVTAEGNRCSPGQAAGDHDGKQATALMLVPLAIDAVDVDLSGDTITLAQNEDGMYYFALLWVDAEATFQAGTGACLSGEEAKCNIRGRFLTDVNPYLATGADFTGVQLVDWDPASLVGIVQLVD